MRQPGIEPGSTAWEAAMLTITPLSPIHRRIINLPTGRRTYRPAATFRLRNAGIYLAHLTMFLIAFKTGGPSRDIAQLAALAGSGGRGTGDGGAEP